MARRTLLQDVTTMDYETINNEVTMRAEADPRTGRLGNGASILGRYTVLGELGQGGMGVV